ncbi:MAG: SPOR domain-containing protein [Proteobacteria bacterium]|nr:SPOR domain-containing protein [Pseudomonadota bacterium]
MTERNTDVVDEVAGDEDPRKQLLIRAGVAGGLIAALLGGLSVFDYVSRPPAPAEAPLPTRPIAPAQVTPDVGRDAPPDVLRAGSEASAPDTVPPQEESAPPMLPGGGVAADSEAPSRAMRSGRIGEASRAAPPHGGSVAQHAPASQAPAPATPGATVAPHGQAPAAPMPVPAPASVRQPVAQEVPQSAPAATSQAPRPAVSTAPAAPVAASSVAPRQVAPAASPTVPAQAPQAPASPTRAETLRPYALEYGVFSNAGSAEALRARLAQAGIPSQLEIRVVVGPFADRKEALAAQARLREKGIDPGTLLQLGR